MQDFVGEHVVEGCVAEPLLFVDVSRDLDFGLARMYEQLLEIQSSIAVMVFRDIEEAKGWLLEADEPV